MSKEEMIKTIKQIIEFTEDVCIYETENKTMKEVLNYIDELQKENEDMREELQMYVDTPINKLIVENEELKFFAESYRKQIKLMQEEYKKGDFIHKGFIRDKIKELEEELIQNYGTLGENLTTTEIKVLKELLGELK